MSNILNHLRRLFLLWLVGGAAYVLIEYIYRQRSHWTMFIVGGICFVAIGLINEWFTFEMYFITQMAISAVIVTIAEFISGCIINIYFQWNVWDYSNLPFNVLGQICLPFIFIWFLISPIAIVLDDFLRHYWFGEEYPHYTFLVHKLH